MEFTVSERIERRYRGRISRAEVEQILARAALAEAGLGGDCVSQIQIDLQAGADGACLGADVLIIEVLDDVAREAPAAPPSFRSARTEAGHSVDAGCTPGPALVGEPEAAPAPQVQEALTPTEPALIAHLRQIPVPRGWSMARDHELLDLACDDMAPAEIAALVERPEAFVTHRIERLTGVVGLAPHVWPLAAVRDALAGLIEEAELDALTEARGGGPLVIVDPAEAEAG